jgi:hypothetical protein
MGHLLSCGAWNKNESQPDHLLGKLPGVLADNVLGKLKRRVPRKTPRRSPGKRKAKLLDKEA